jgi:hypothetical protein
MDCRETLARSEAIEARYRELVRREFPYFDQDKVPRLRAQAKTDVEREAAEAHRRAEDAKRRNSERERGHRDALRPSLGTSDPQLLARTWTAILESFGRECDIRIDWRDGARVARHATAYANRSQRTVVVPKTTGARREDVEAAAAVVLHEIGHILAGPCGGADHSRDRTVREWWHCLRCERDAWHQAMQLWPFTPAMFARLQGALGTYRRKTPGPATAVAAVDRQVGTVTFREHQSAWRRFQDKVDWLEQQKKGLRHHAF